MVNPFVFVKVLLRTFNRTSSQYKSMVLLFTVFMGCQYNIAITKHRKKREAYQKSLERLQIEQPDWSCYFAARQYRAECVEAPWGVEEGFELCKKLQDKFAVCKEDLYKEICKGFPYAMDVGPSLVNRPPWIPPNK